MAEKESMVPGEYSKAVPAQVATSEAEAGQHQMVN